MNNIIFSFSPICGSLCNYRHPGLDLVWQGGSDLQYLPFPVDAADLEQKKGRLTFVVKTDFAENDGSFLPSGLRLVCRVACTGFAQCPFGKASAGHWAGRPVHGKVAGFLRSEVSSRSCLLKARLHQTHLKFFRGELSICINSRSTTKRPLCYSGNLIVSWKSNHVLRV